MDEHDPTTESCAGLSAQSPPDETPVGALHVRSDGWSDDPPWVREGYGSALARWFDSAGDLSFSALAWVLDSADDDELPEIEELAYGHGFSTRDVERAYRVTRRG